ncbi:MAG: DUF29 domain-containing protein [Pseudomonadota bacterium]|nr:DUF29 domain-containing protein [Pseudomonadota bacterium]
MGKMADYDTYFYAWALYNARLLKEGKFSELDVEHLIEELEDRGNNRQELANRFIILLAHLLKWQYQPDKRSSGSINEQRVRIMRLIRQKPSLKPGFAHAILDAVALAVKDTKKPATCFPQACPYSIEQLLDEHFYPES